MQSIYDILGLTSSINIVDIGANPIDGNPPYAPLLSAGHANVVGFEPNLDALAVLNEKKGPTETYLPHAVGDGKRHTLHFCQAPGMTSLLEPNKPVLDLFHGFPDWGKVLGTEEVTTVRLDDVPETEGIDYIKIDIQGGELMVFENATERLKNAVLIHTEVEFLPMYVNQPLFADVDQFLRKQGFLIHRFEPLSSRALKPLVANNDIYAGFSQIFWADAIFIRDITQLEKMSPEQLLKLAVILHECYRAYDVALHLLNAHDRRSNTTYGDRYMKAVTGQ